MSNVLPPEAKMRVVRDTQARMIVVGSTVASLAALLAILALTPAFLTSAIPLLSDAVPGESDETTELYEVNRKESSRIRATLAVLNPFTEERKSVQKIIARVYELRPEGVDIERIQYQSGKSGQITLTGLSEAREPVNDFRASLVAEGVFSNVSVPVAALVGALDGLSLANFDMTRMTIFAWVSAVVAISLWSGFGLMVWQLGEVRAKVAMRDAELKVRDEKDKNSAQLQSLMRDTREERTALANLSTIDALAAAATMEAAGKKAGATVSIASAVTDAAGNEISSDLRSVTFVANSVGEFPRLMHVSELLEALPFPSRIDSYELFSLDPEKGQKDPWRMSVRIRAIIPDSQ
jgi:Tfp pilus assembly protein PilN